MLSKSTFVKSLSLTRALSSKTTPVSSAAAAREGLRFDNQAAISHQDDHDDPKSILRADPNLIKPKFKSFSYAIGKSNNTHLLCDTIGDRLKILANDRPSDVGYKFSLTKTGLTFGEIKQRVDEVAQNFLQLGFKKGTR